MKKAIIFLVIIVFISLSLYNFRYTNDEFGRTVISSKLPDVVLIYTTEPIVDYTGANTDTEVEAAFADSSRHTGYYKRLYCIWIGNKLYTYNEGLLRYQY